MRAKTILGTSISGFTMQLQKRLHRRVLGREVLRQQLSTQDSELSKEEVMGKVLERGFQVFIHN
jgi:hypothetical protein